MVQPRSAVRGWAEEHRDRNDYSLGGWGGSCTCPNGEVYQVADNGDSCGSLACNGGTSGTCNQWDGEWSNRGVQCFPASPAPTPQPTAEPTAEPTAAPTPAPTKMSCMNFCYKGGLDASSDKCKWTTCTGCPECNGLEGSTHLGCKPWCSADSAHPHCDWQNC